MIIYKNQNNSNMMIQNEYYRPIKYFLNKFYNKAYIK